MWQYTYSDELYHYGVLGMKWGVRKSDRRGISGAIRGRQIKNAQRDLSSAKSKRKQIDSELKELRGYENNAKKNPKSFGAKKIPTAIRNHQIKSLEKMKSKEASKIKDNEAALKELNAIDKYAKGKQNQSQTSNERRRDVINKTGKIAAGAWAASAVLNKIGQSQYNKYANGASSGRVAVIRGLGYSSKILNAVGDLAAVSQMHQWVNYMSNNYRT